MNNDYVNGSEDNQNITQPQIDTVFSQDNNFFRESDYGDSFMQGRAPAFRKPACSYDEKDRIFAIFSLAIGFTAVKVMTNMADSIGFLTACLCVGLTVFNLLYTKKHGLNGTKKRKILFAVTIALSFVFVITDNNYVKLINYWFVLISNAYYVYSGYKSNHNSIIINVMKSIAISPFYEYGSMFEAVFQKKQENKKITKKNELIPIILGVVLSIPVCVVVMSLLMQSDRNFGIGLEKIFREIGNWFFDHFFVNIVLFGFSLPVSMYIFGAVYSRAYKMKHEKELNKPQKSDSRILPSSLCNAFLSPLTLIYIAFVFTQCSYLFSTYNTVNESFDYSQYARSGFFELCAVCIINLAVITAIMFLVKLKDKKLPKSVAIFIVSFSVLTLCLIVTAIVKMMMYIDMYGMTPLRVYTSIFMIYLFIMFIVMIIKQFADKISFTKIGYILAAAVLLAMSVLPVDRYIAEYNLCMYDKGEIEWVGENAMMELDSSAVSVFAECSEKYFFNDQVVSEQIQSYLKNKNDLGRMDIYSFNFTRFFAAKKLEANKTI